MSGGPILKSDEQELELFNIPSENYLLQQRWYTFLDEWFFYIVLGILYLLNDYGMMVVVAIHGAIFLAVSYRRQWNMESRRFDTTIERKKNE